MLDIMKGNGELAKRTVKAELLKTWLESEGCLISQKVSYPSEFEGVFGVVAREEVGPGESLVLIKNNVIFSTELLENSELDRIFLCFPEFFGKENPEGQDNQYLTLLLYEKQKKKDSKWKYYLDVLPQSIETLADWSLDELRELQDEDLVEDLGIRNKKNASSFETLQEILRNFPHFFPQGVGVEEIELCWRIISTRCFMRSNDHSALVPFADFFNHGESTAGFYFVDQNENAENFVEELDEIMSLEEVVRLSCQELLEINFSAYDWKSEEMLENFRMLQIEAEAVQKTISKKSNPIKDDIKNSDFIVTTGKSQNFHAGDQILLEYGSYSNTSLLLHYGFSILNNRHESFRLKLKLSDLLTHAQQHSLPLKFSLTSTLVFQISCKELSRDFLRVLRALNWLPENKKTSFFSQSDLKLEQKVLKRYLHFMNSALNRFPTSILQDRTSKSRSIREKFAVRPT